MISNQAMQDFAFAFNRGELCVDLLLGPAGAALPEDEPHRVVMRVQRRELQHGITYGPQFTIDRELLEVDEGVRPYPFDIPRGAQ